jgi:O-antigen/teichoic acid export membrane protein
LSRSTEIPLLRPARIRVSIIMKRFLLGGTVVSAGLATEYGVQMLRMLILARLLGPADFGIVVSLNAVHALVTMSTWVGVERFLIHVTDGHRRKWLGVAHTLSIAKSILAAFVLLVLAWPTAWLLSIPETVGSFISLALIQLVSAPTHMRTQQLQRRHIFWPSAAATTVGNIGGLLVAAVAAFLLRDHRALIWSLCATSAICTAATHMLTHVPYRLSFARNDLRQALQFGLPLMFNGLALALLGQLDRLVVGALLGVISMGRYGLAMTLVLTPISLLLNVATLISQPYLSAAWHSSVKTAFPELFGRITKLFAILGLMFALGAAVLGDVLLPILFGPSFAVGDVFIATLSVIALVRFTKVLTNVGSLAIGRTMDLMMSNAAGAAGLLITAFALWWRPTLEMAVLGYLSGELLATLFVVLRLDKALRGGGGPSPFWNFLASVPVLLCVALWIVLVDPPWPTRCVLLPALLTLAGAVGWRLMAPLRRRTTAGPTAPSVTAQMP